MESQSSPLVQSLASQDPPNQHHRPPSQLFFSGKTIDFTLFAVTRAIDVLAITLWTRTRSRKWHPEHVTPRLANTARWLTDPAIFAFSASIIMWSWFYSPERLPRAYNHWISTAAAIDVRLITALRLARRGEWIYGQDTGYSKLLEPLCESLGLPTSLADPAHNIPVPCELVHMGTGPSCEYHALSRFVRAFAFALKMYLPLQLVLRLRPFVLRSRNRNPPPLIPLLTHAFLSAARSSAFLGAFVSLFYYGVCLSRTRLGPPLAAALNGHTSTSPHLPANTTTTTSSSSHYLSPQSLDSGLCVQAGCMLCGASIMAEKAGRRHEIAFFVAPRALATLLPRVYPARYRGRERAVFAASVAVVLASVGPLTGRHDMVRGVLGTALARVMAE